MKLNEVIPWGRSFDEYRRVFSLTEGDLAGHVLGCGDGPASFNAEATALGHCVVSCDPIYAFTASEIERRVEECYDTVISQVKKNLEGFVWDCFRDPDHLGSCRLAAMRGFLEDFEKGKQEGRYVAVSLPTLPFVDGLFSLALVSHLLFLYSEQLGLTFHTAAFKELLRVAGEVRVFPLLGLDRQWSPHVGPVREHLERAGFEAEVVAVQYRFQRADDHAGNWMLRVHWRPACPAGSKISEASEGGDMARVIGIGGVFFRSGDPERLYGWYEKHLGLRRSPGGVVLFPWRQAGDEQKDQTTVWSLFPKGTDYFGPANPAFMVNYIVDDLDGMIVDLRTAGAQVEGGQEESEYGRFAWVTDPEGNRIELWQPPSRPA